MPPPDTDLAARVRAGMAFLDQRLGPGWEEHIDAEHIDVVSSTDNPLAQLGRAGLFGTFSEEEREWSPFARVRRRFGWTAATDQSARYGFDVAPEDLVTRTSSHRAVVALNAAWRAQLAARRAGKEAAE